MPNRLVVPTLSEEMERHGLEEVPPEPGALAGPRVRCRACGRTIPPRPTRTWWHCPQGCNVPEPPPGRALSAGHPHTRLVDPSTGLSHCTRCGHYWWVSYPGRGNRRPRGWWKCPEGCDDVD